MEAFILADRVIAQKHMETPTPRPKYLKKYDLPPHTPAVRVRTAPNRKHLKCMALINVPKVKDLLSDLS